MFHWHPVFMFHDTSILSSSYHHTRLKKTTRIEDAKMDRYTQVEIKHGRPLFTLQWMPEWGHWWIMKLGVPWGKRVECGKSNATNHPFGNCLFLSPQVFAPSHSHSVQSRDTMTRQTRHWSLRQGSHDRHHGLYHARAFPISWLRGRMGRILTELDCLPQYSNMMQYVMTSR